MRRGGPRHAVSLQLGDLAGHAANSMVPDHEARAVGVDGARVVQVERRLRTLAAVRQRLPDELALIGGV
jgi:hypothetical protein